MQLNNLINIIKNTKSITFKPKYTWLDDEIKESFENIGFSVYYVKSIDSYIAKFKKNNSQFDLLLEPIKLIIQKYHSFCEFEPLNQYIAINDSSFYHQFDKNITQTDNKNNCNYFHF